MLLEVAPKPEPMVLPQLKLPAMILASECKKYNQYMLTLFCKMKLRTKFKETHSELLKLLQQ